MSSKYEAVWESHQDIWKRLSGASLLMTGGTGFFGRSVLELISDFNRNKNLDLKLTILTRNKDAFCLQYPNLSSHSWLQFFEGDIVDFKSFPEKFEYIFHFATPASATMNIESPLKMFDVIVDGTRRILEYARDAKVKSVLLASSGAVYGRQPPELERISETSLLAPDVSKTSSAYGEGKRVAELLGTIFSSQHGFQFKIARCYAFVGPHLDPSGTFAIGNFIRDALTKNEIEIKGDGTPIRSYLYSDDLVVWLFKVLLDGQSGRPYNVGSDKEVSILDLAKKVVEVVNPSVEIRLQNKPIAGRLPERYVPSVELAKTELKLDVWTNLEEAIRATAKFYKTIL